MTIAKGRLFIFTFPRSWVSGGASLADANLCELRGKKPTCTRRRQGKDAGIWGGGYIEPWAYRACSRAGERPLPC
jgi:hypothetical protein